MGKTIRLSFFDGFTSVSRPGDPFELPQTGFDPETVIRWRFLEPARLARDSLLLKMRGEHPDFDELPLNSPDDALPLAPFRPEIVDFMLFLVFWPILRP